MVEYLAMMNPFGKMYNENRYTQTHIFVEHVVNLLRKKGSMLECGNLVDLDKMYFPLVKTYLQKISFDKANSDHGVASEKLENEPPAL